MPDLNHWLKLYESRKPAIKARAARGLLGRSSETPLTILLNILDTKWGEGLGADVEKALLERRDPELVPEMISRLKSPDPFIREVACVVLGKSGDRRATPHLLRMLDDPRMWLRRQAAFALAFLEDPAAIPELKRQYVRRQNDDINVKFGLETALKSLGVEYDNLS
jgi:HEAT repeat protein